MLSKAVNTAFSLREGGRITAFSAIAAAVLRKPMDMTLLLFKVFTEPTLYAYPGASLCFSVARADYRPLSFVPSAEGA